MTEVVAIPAQTHLLNCKCQLDLGQGTMTSLCVHCTTQNECMEWPAA